MNIRYGMECPGCAVEKTEIANRDTRVSLITDEGAFRRKHDTGAWVIRSEMKGRDKLLWGEGCSADLSDNHTRSCIGQDSRIQD